MIFARSGWQVRLYDAGTDVAASAVALCAAGLQDLAAAGLCDAPADAAANITAYPTLAQAVAGVDMVQENGPEDQAAKQALFAELDRLAPPDAILASSSSGIRVSLFTEGLPGRARCLIGHPVNPPHLIPVVELSGAPWTSPDVIARARAIYAAIGQTPVTVLKEVEGFILNRLQGALLAEAFRLVAEGYVSPQDLDSTVKDGLGLRWAFMGPFETIDLNAPGGIADYARRLGGLYRDIAAETTEQRGWDNELIARIEAQRREVLPEAELVARSAWRDRRLMALALHKRRMDAADAAGTDPAATPGTQ
jgi:3-hydroxyacyl-CoA dehydrogenase